MELLPALANASGWAVAFGIAFWVLRSIVADKLVPGETHRRALRELAYWRDKALRGTELAEVATDAAEARGDAE